MKEKKVCPVCKKITDTKVVDVCVTAYNYLIERIKEEHPEWVEKDGVCPRCVEYYEKM